MSTTGPGELSRPGETTIARLEKIPQYPYLWFALPSAIRHLRVVSANRLGSHSARRSPLSRFGARSALGS